MKSFCIFLFSAAISVACSASKTSDAINTTILKTIMPTGSASAVVSPYSVAFMSGVLCDGMDDRDQRVELSTRLDMGTADFRSVYRRIRATLDEWTASNRVEVLFANSMWTRNYAHLNLDFHMMAHESYDVVFGPLTDALPINSWVSVKTDGLVPKVMDSLDPACNTVVASASAFNGAWSRPFPPAQQGVFHAEGGDVQIPMMTDIRVVRSLDRPGYKAFSLAYRGGKLMLFVLIPKEGHSTYEFVGNISLEELDLLDRAFLPGYRPEDARGELMPDVEGLSVAVTRITMPKIRVETGFDCLPVFDSLGIPKTGYDTICKGLSIGVAVQCAVFETSETGGEVGKVELPEVKAEGEIREIVCDRPFAFFVRTVDHLTLLAGQFNGK